MTQRIFWVNAQFAVLAENKDDAALRAAAGFEALAHGETEPFFCGGARIEPGEIGFNGLLVGIA